MEKAIQFLPGAEKKDPAIDVSNLSHFFGEKLPRNQVLFDNQLSVLPGEIVIMTGPSGSGKTTLLTLIGSLRRVQQGQLMVLGQPLDKSSNAEIVELRKRIGFIFQAHNLFSSLTALQNVRMALELQKSRLSRSRQNEACIVMLEAVGLGERVNFKPGGLSGGQKQRVAVARGLVHQPDIVLARRTDCCTGQGIWATGDGVVPAGGSRSWRCNRDRHT